MSQGDGGGEGEPTEISEPTGLGAGLAHITASIYLNFYLYFQLVFVVYVSMVFHFID
jgi:hypothetical protein